MLSKAAIQYSHALGDLMYALLPKYRSLGYSLKDSVEMASEEADKLLFDKSYGKDFIQRATIKKRDQTL